MLGFLSCGDIVYLFVVGNTPILAIFPFAFALAFFALLFKKKGIVSLKKTIKSINLELKLFFLFCVFSIVSLIIFGNSYYHQWLVGVINLFLFAELIMVAIMLGNYRNSLLLGAFCGVAFGVLFDLFSFFLGAQNSVLPVLFPAFAESIGYKTDFSFAGLFRERGYFARYLTIMFLPIWHLFRNKNKIFKFGYVVLIIFLFAFTRSASTIIGAFCFLIYYVLSKVAEGKWKKIIIGAVVSGIFLILLFSIDFKIEFVNAIKENLVDIFSGSEGNKTRLYGVTFSLEIARLYLPFGCGWNCFSQAFSDLGYYNYIAPGSFDPVKGSYSGLVQLVAEMGFFVLPLLVFFLKSFFVNVRIKNNYSLIISCALLATFLEMLLTNMILEPCAALVFGLAIYNQTFENRKVLNLIKNRNISSAFNDFSYELN